MVQALKWVAGGRGDRRRPSAVRPTGRGGRLLRVATHRAPPFPSRHPPRSTSRSRVLTTYLRRPTSILVLRLGWRFAARVAVPAGRGRGRGILLLGSTDELGDARRFASSTDGSPRGTTAEARPKGAPPASHTTRRGLAAPLSSTPSHSPEPKLGARHMVSEDQTEKICYSIQVGVIPCLADDNFPPRSLRPLMAPPNPEPRTPTLPARPFPSPPIPCSHSRAGCVARGAFGRRVVVSLWCRAVSSTPLALLAVLCDTIPYCQ